MSCPAHLKYAIEGSIEDHLLGIPFDVIYLDEIPADRLDGFHARRRRRRHPVLIRGYGALSLKVADACVDGSRSSRRLNKCCTAQLCPDPIDPPPRRSNPTNIERRAP